MIWYNEVMNRNTLIVIIFLGIFAAFVAGVNLGKKPLPSNIQDPTPTATPFLSDSTCGISFSYPNTLTKVDIGNGGVTLVNTKTTGDTLVVVCQAEIPRVPLPPEKIDIVPIGSVSAQLFHDASQKDGTPIDKLIFAHPGLQEDVYIAGYGKVFNDFIKTIVLL